MNSGALKKNELSLTTGLSTSYIPQFESGIREGTVDSLWAIAEALNVRAYSRAKAGTGHIVGNLTVLWK